MRRQQPHDPPANEARRPQHKYAMRLPEPPAKLLGRALISGTCASICSSIVLLAAGRKDCGSALAPINAVSHWVWADRTFQEGRSSFAYTFTGYVIHHAMSVLWAICFEGVASSARSWLAGGHSMLAGPLVAGVAAGVDLKLTPERLTPGFERKVTGLMLTAVYLAFGLALAMCHAIRVSGQNARQG